MKKQETPAQPQAVPDAFSRPIGTGAPSKAAGAPYSLGTDRAIESGRVRSDAFSDDETRLPFSPRRPTVAQLTRFHARLHLARLHRPSPALEILKRAKRNLARSRRRSARLEQSKYFRNHYLGSKNQI